MEMMTCQWCGARVPRHSANQKYGDDCRQEALREQRNRQQKKAAQKMDTHSLLQLVVKAERATGRSYGKLVREAEAGKVRLEDYLKEVLNGTN